jgi:hypothetical protein
MTTQQSFETLANVKFASRLMFAANDGAPTAEEKHDELATTRPFDQENQSKNQATSLETAEPVTHYQTLMLAALSLEVERASLLDQVATLTKKVEQDAEKVKFHDDIADTTDL